MVRRCHLQTTIPVLLARSPSGRAKLSQTWRLSSLKLHFPETAGVVTVQRRRCMSHTHSILCILAFPKIGGLDFRAVVDDGKSVHFLRDL